MTTGKKRKRKEGKKNGNGKTRGGRKGRDTELLIDTGRNEDINLIGEKKVSILCQTHICLGRMFASDTEVKLFVGMQTAKTMKTTKTEHRSSPLPKNEPKGETA